MKSKSLKFVTLSFAAIVLVFIMSFTSYAKSNDTTTGWHHNKNGWWYSYSDGSCAKNNIVYIKGKYYYFDKSGYMKTGWQKLKIEAKVVGGSKTMKFGKSDYYNWYYFKSDGSMAHDEFINGYYLTQFGFWNEQTKCKWIKKGSDWYYVHDKTNYPFRYDIGASDLYCYIVIDGKRYCFDENSKMYANCYIGNNKDGWKWIGKNGQITYSSILKRSPKFTDETGWEFEGYKYKDTKNWVPKNAEYLFVDDFYMGRWKVKFNSSGKAIKVKDCCEKY